MKPFPQKLLPLLLIPLSSCSFKFQPCAEGGDVSWEPKITGTMECFQRRDRGVRTNQGRFRQWHSNGKIALEGAFNDGKRDGVWSYYDELGEKKTEKAFENGVEKAMLSPSPQKITN